MKEMEELLEKEIREYLESFPDPIPPESERLLRLSVLAGTLIGCKIILSSENPKKACVELSVTSLLALAENGTDNGSTDSPEQTSPAGGSR